MERKKKERKGGRGKRLEKASDGEGGEHESDHGSCAFAERDQQSITAVKVAGQRPYILLKGKQSFSITRTHT